MEPAESSRGSESEDSVTFEGNNVTTESKPKPSSIANATRDFSTVQFCSSKNDEPTLLDASHTMIRSMPVANIDATNDDNESMPLISSCKQRRSNKLNKNYRRPGGNGQTIPETTYDNVREMVVPRRGGND